MSGNDTFLGRWSRLKRAEVAAEKAPPAPEHDETAAAPGETPAEPPSEQVVATVAPEDLPKVEDLTAESDISAFLKKGVPKALKAAALRRAWSLDPAIRDYVGPQEYAWDFNDPGAMHGFGGGSSLDELGRAVRSMRGSEDAAGAAPPTPSPSAADAASAPTEPAGDVAADPVTEPASERPARTAEAGDASPQASERTETKTPPTPDAEAKPASGRRHGGAIPT